MRRVRLELLHEQNVGLAFGDAAANDKKEEKQTKLIGGRKARSAGQANSIVAVPALVCR